MTYQEDFTLLIEIVEQVAEQGLDFLPELIRIVINTAMQVERQKYLGVGPYERSAERRGRSNGFKSKTVSTRIAVVLARLVVPEVDHLLQFLSYDGIKVPIVVDHKTTTIKIRAMDRTTPNSTLNRMAVNVSSRQMFNRALCYPYVHDFHDFCPGSSAL